VGRLDLPDVRRDEDERGAVERLQDEVYRLQADRQRLRDAGAGGFALELNRLRLVGATHALNAALVARYCQTELHPLAATLVADEEALD
jgi:hypothetical protein